MAFIALNGSYNVPQPSDLSEEATQKLTDRVTIKGVTHRYFQAQKYTVKLKYTALTQSQFNTLKNIFYSNGKTVTYTNANSGLSFTGYPTAAEDPYYHGASFLKDFNVTIVQK